MTKPLIDPAYRTRVKDALTARHGSQLRNEALELDVHREGTDAVVQLVLKSHDRTSVYKMEAAVRRDQYPGMTLEAAIDLALDFLDWYLGEYLREERETILPLDWKAHRYGDVEVLARGDLRNEFLDEMADAWLRGERPDVEREYKQLKRRH